MKTYDTICSILEIRALSSTKLPNLFRIRSEASILSFLLAACSVILPCSSQQGASSELQWYPGRPRGGNSVCFAQVPDMPDLFIARQPTPIDNPNHQKFMLTLEQMDWTTHTINIGQPILQPPVSIMHGTARIDGAHDPSIAKFNGEYWIAFESAGKGLPGTCACVGPFNPLHPEKGIDPNRITPVVVGGSNPPQPRRAYAASVPGLLNYQHHLYLYWSAPCYQPPPPPPPGQHRIWFGVGIRGMELVQESGGLRRLWGKGANGPVCSVDPSKNVEVWGVNPNDPNGNTTIDLMGSTFVGTYGKVQIIYGIAARGGQGCVFPDGNFPGCYRMTVACATQPLGYHIFNQHVMPDGLFPINPQQYVRLFHQPDGRLFLMGQFMNPTVKINSPSDITLKNGFYWSVVPPGSPILQFGRQIAQAAQTQKH